MLRAALEQFTKLMVTADIEWTLLVLKTGAQILARRSALQNNPEAQVLYPGLGKCQCRQRAISQIYRVSHLLL